MWSIVLLTVMSSIGVNSFIHLLQNRTLIFTPKCRTQLENLPQALISQMVDSSSKILTSIHSVKYGDLGDFDSCVRIPSGKYCLGYITSGNNSLVEVPTWALCLPNACSTEDANLIGQTIFQNFDKISVAFSDLLCQTVDDVNPKLTSQAIFAIIIIVCLICTLFGCTIYDVYTTFYLKNNHCPEILKGLSFYSNGKKIFKMDNSTKEELSSLNGLKCISMMWVVAVHQFSVPKYGTIVNPTEILTWYDNLRSMLIISGHISVDTFLTVGGTLLSYGFMKARSKGVSFNLLVFYLHRYLRLTAPLSLVVLVSATLLKYMGSGPKWPFLVLYFQKNCEDYWWSALLYVQNYVNVSHMCVGQTWYLDIDWQLYLVSPLPLFMLWKYPKIFSPFLALLSLIFVVLPFYIAWTNDLPAITSNMYSNHKNDYMNKYYLLTHTRCTPWIFGLLLGYFIYRIKQDKVILKMNRVVLVIIWAVSIATLVTCVLVGHSNLRKPDYDKMGNALHIGLVRPIWSLAIVWIILTCTTGYGGVLNWTLSLPIYKVLNKFTYSVYLTHVTFLYVIAYGKKWPDYFSEFNMAYQYLGTLSFSSGLSVLLVFITECPVFALEKILIGGKSESKNTLPKGDSQTGVYNVAFEG